MRCFDDSRPPLVCLRHTAPTRHSEGAPGSSFDARPLVLARSGLCLALMTRAARVPRPTCGRIPVEDVVVLVLVAEESRAACDEPLALPLDGLADGNEHLPRRTDVERVHLRGLKVVVRRLTPRVTLVMPSGVPLQRSAITNASARNARHDARIFARASSHTHESSAGSPRTEQRGEIGAIGLTVAGQIASRCAPRANESCQIGAIDCTTAVEVAGAA